MGACAGSTIGCKQLQASMWADILSLLFLWLLTQVEQMDAGNCEQACGLVSRSYINQGQQALARRHRLIKALLSSRRLPEQGWDEPTIEAFVQVCVCVVCVCVLCVCVSA